MQQSFPFPRKIVWILQNTILFIFVFIFFSRDYEMRRSCDHLDTLILRGNQIQELEARLFKDCHKLRELSLSFNQINRIDSEAFRSDHL